VADAKEVRAIDRPLQPLSLYLGALGMTGFTAWVGLGLAEVKAGEHVFVSGAAGAVGSVAGQLAKLRGCRVVGSAGSAGKVGIVLDEFGFDAAFNYKDGGVGDQLRAAAPEGIDVYFDNVGGDHLEAALGAMRVNGRIVACGAIARYNDTEPTPGPRNCFLIVTKRLTIRGFIVSDWSRRLPEFLNEVTPYVANGQLRSRETVVEGLARAPEAFMGLFRGENLGKMLVKLA
jgi:NADPH-dependent curcumin reductase CurA